MGVLRVLLCLTVVLVGARGFACSDTEELRFAHWMEESSSANESIGAVNAIAQDARGVIWAGGQNGLARFNGSHFSLFRYSVNDPASISNSYVSAITSDSSGALWVGTHAGLNRYDPRTESFSRFDRLNAGLPADNINSLVFAEGRLWIGTTQGLWSLDPAANRAEEIAPLRGQDIRALAPGESGELWLGTLNGLGLWQTQQAQFTWHGNRAFDVRALARDERGNLWVGTFNHGLLRLKVDNDEWRSFGKAAGLAGQLIWALEYNARGELWVASELGGVSRFDPVAERFWPSTWHANKPASLASNKAKALKTDALGDLWVGLFPNGIDHASRFANQFCNYQGAEDDTGLTHRSVLSVLPSGAKAGDLWIGTEQGLNFFDASRGRFSHFLPEPGAPGRLQSGAILALAPGETADEIWVSAWGSGVYRYNSQSRLFRQILARPGTAQALQTPYVWAMLRAQDGTLYLGGESGGLQIYRGGEQFESFVPVAGDNRSISSAFVRSLLQTRSGRLFVGTTAGLDEYLPASQEFIHWLRDEQGEFRFGASIIALFEGGDGTLWLGTQGAGLIRFDPNSHAFKVFTQADGLPSDFVATINQDADGVIWVSTLRGIARLKAERFEALDKSLGPVGNNFNRNASVYMPDGQLWFGGVDGLTHFNPLTLMAEAASPGAVYLDGLRLLNKPQAIGSSLLPYALDYVSEIVLGSDNPMVTIDFYALNYRAPQLNRFAYKLVGVDADFIDIGNQRSATYTHLPAGHFIFQVKAADSLGQWHPQVKELHLTIKPAWWRSYWAFALYGILVFLVLWALWRLLERRRDLQHAQALNEKLRQLDQLKDTFLANTSHELRTPLNGIIGLAEALLEGAQGPVSDGVHKTLKIISSSGRRLSYLINDILDFSKLSKKDLQLNTRPLALRPLLESVLELVQPLIGDKPLVLFNEVPADLPNVLADPNRLQQILLNLIGNAVKFTPAGSVRVRAAVVGGRIEIHVRDTGIGIEQKDMDAIFLEFSQVDSSDVRAQGGTGLGLAIAKRLVHLHGGQLQVISKPGQGADFYFSLAAATDSAFTDSGLPAAACGAMDINISTLEAPHASSNTLLYPEDIMGRFTVLVVDDDPVNRMVLTSILKLHQHRVVEVNSGQQALDLLSQDNDIDIVILDVMMPIMSGFETAMRIRVRYPVHLLPIIFLTAKNYSDDLVRGFVAGGNDFLTKPVSKQELLTRVTSHLRLLQINRTLEENLKTRDFEATSTQVELQALDTIIASLNREMNPQILLKTLLNQMLLLVQHADGASLWQLSGAKGWICSAALALDHKYLGEQCFSVDQALVNYLTSLGQSHQPIHALRDFKHTPLAPLYNFFEQPEHTLIAVAVAENNLVGYIALSYTGEPPTIDEYLVSAINRIRAHATSVLLKANMMQEHQ